MKKFMAAALAVLILFSVIPVLSASAETLEGFEDIYKIGDVDLNGRITINDATELQRILAQLTEPTDEQMEKADADYDGRITINDATHLQRILAETYIPLVGKKGIDISSNNDSIDMRKVKEAGYDFVMIRCGYGENVVEQDDWNFCENVRKCEELGMPWGVYLFSYALSEVEHVDRLLKAEKAKGYLPTLPIVLDVEWSSYVENHGGWNYDNINRVTTVFVNGIIERGYYPMIYTGYSILEDFMSEYLQNEIDCWFAEWWIEPDLYHFNRMGIWQYGGENSFLESTEIEGVGVVDKNVCYRDYPLLIKNGGYNGW